MITFQDLNLISPLMQAIEAEGYTTPTPIQAEAIPIVLANRDLLGVAQTGTGKTAAFSIPILQLLENAKTIPARKRPIRALIITPTRELAIQIDESIAAYGKFTKLTHTVIFGGVKQTSQVNILRNGVDILVATPGRLLDLINQKIIYINQVEKFVLDEADRMLDMGFVHDIKKVIALLPKERQSLFFSATMPPSIQKLADSILYQPLKVEVTPVSSTADTINQAVYMVEKNDKNSLLLEILKNKSIETVLVFTRTKHGADKVVKTLIKNDIKAEAIHGNKAQNARQRALENFKNRTTRVLVATDIAARGIDVDDLAHVINFEMPNIPETYVHRIGRTGRAGANGTAFSFCDVEERPFLRDIQKLIGKTLPIIEGHNYESDAVETNAKPAPKPQQTGRPNHSTKSPDKVAADKKKPWFRNRK